MKKNNETGGITLRKTSGGNDYVRAAVFIFDFILLNVLFLGFVFIFTDRVPPYFDVYTRQSLLVVNFTMLIAEYFFHTIVQRRLVTVANIAGNTLKLVGTQVVLMFLMVRFLSDGETLFPFLVVFGTTSYVVFMVSRIIERWALRCLRKMGRNTQSVLFVGHDLSLARLYRDLTMTTSMGYRVKGYYAHHEMKNPPAGLKYLGTIEDLNALLDRWDADPLLDPGVNGIFCSVPHEEEKEVMRIVRSCDKSVVRFFYVPRIFEDYEMNLSMQQFGNYTVFTNREEPLTKPMNRFIKRTFDLCFSLVVCIFLLPVILIVGLIIKLQSPGPIFFRQGRTGLDGNTFDCYKFRSMHVNKDSDNVQATKDDPRKFPFGNFMRKTNIDELPQFFNVLKGDMSIVGPRPHMLHHTELYGRLIDKYMVRHFAKPGITGWAQVTGFRGETSELWQMEERVRRDIWYVENWSFWLDIRIIFRTVKSFFVHDEHAY